MEWYFPDPSRSPVDKMDAPSRVPDQENEGDEQPSEFPIPGDGNAQETSDHGLPLVSEMTRLQMLLLTITAFPSGTGSRNKT